MKKYTMGMRSESGEQLEYWVNHQNISTPNTHFMKKFNRNWEVSHAVIKNQMVSWISEAAKNHGVKAKPQKYAGATHMDNDVKYENKNPTIKIISQGIDEQYVGTLTNIKVFEKEEQFLHIQTRKYNPWIRLEQKKSIYSLLALKLWK